MIRDRVYGVELSRLGLNPIEGYIKRIMQSYDNSRYRMGLKFDYLEKVVKPN